MATARLLLDSPAVRVTDLRCGSPRSGPSAERGAEPAHLALLRRGAFTYHLGARAFLGDATTALLHLEPASYRVSHPGPDGDEVTVVELPGETLPELFGRAPAVAWAVAPAAQLRHHRLIGALTRGALGALAAEEAVLGLLAELARHAAFPPRLSRRDRRLVDGAKARLHADLGRNLALTDVAAALGASPFRLMRTFRAATGLSVRAWRRRARVLEALARIAAGEDDLGALAVRVGFAHHSHLTDSFRDVLGAPPSALRRLVRARLEQDRTFLEAR
ncbi:helix-turn-helix domain-containing protein [Anaeromyxobacter sp. Red801]|uniref:helix-turn-helix transcriptional regulator n=1 Tax=Anaeromyxobacter sp. Red801 TaxID=3411632 RepID=UPI003BA1B345